MSDKEIDATTAVVYHLREHLLKHIPELTILEEFPEPNQELTYPCLTIVTGSPDFETLVPYEYSQGIIKNSRVPLRMVIGNMDTTLQLDLWAGTKPERAVLREKVFRALNPRAMEGISGLGLKLSRYFDTWANLTISGIPTEDTEVASQRSEWRSTINVLANYRSIAVGDAPVIEQTETHLQVTENEIDESDDSGIEIFEGGETP